MKRRIFGASLGAMLSLAFLAFGCGYDDASGSSVETVMPGGSNDMPGSSPGTSAAPGSSPSMNGPGVTPATTGGEAQGGLPIVTPVGEQPQGGLPVAPGVPAVPGAPLAAAVPPKPRIIVQTDGEVDDRSSFVRYLMYASDYDTVGIVQSNSRYQRDGHSDEEWVEEEIALYAEALPNLRKHNPDYPEASALLNVLRVGNENNADLFVAPPSMEVKETAGSRLMLEELLNDDPRPLHVATWGGANTLAYALYSLRATDPERLAQVADKLWVYCIWYQDNGGQWIEDNIPGVHIYEAYRWDNVWDYQSLTGPSPANVKEYMTTNWLNENVKTNHGALGVYTPQSYVSEGDTPSFLPHINNGLYQSVNYTRGGWGGRPAVTAGTHMTDAADDDNEYKPFWRWIPTLQNDFAARMDWVVAANYGDANHNPKAQVVGGLQRSVAGGETVTLDASPTMDPDGDTLTYKWWQYYDADSADAELTIANDAAPTGASFTVPSEPGRQLHIILEVTDNGTPPLTHYQRVIFDIQ